MFRGLGNLASLLRQARQMGGRMQALNDKLKGERATGSTGGGMVQVEVNGLGEVLRVRIDPTLVARGEREMIEDLLPAAVNQAVAKANQLRLEAMQNMAQELNVPGLDAALAQLSGANDSNTKT
jgi:DNA-binding YbaB/EbfC family protein